MGGGGGGGRVNKNKLMYQLRTENKKFISFDKYDYGGDLPATDKVLSLKSFPYKMTKQTDGSYFLASSGQRSKSLLFFPSLTSRTSRRFTEKKKKILLKDHVFILVSSFCTLQVLLNIEIVRLFFPQDICLALNIIFLGGEGRVWVKMWTDISLDGQSFHTNGNELLTYMYTSIRSKM